MSNPHEIPGALEGLQDAIYRERVLRARKMTPVERIEAVFNLSELQMGMLHAGEMHRHNFTDPSQGWEKVAQSLRRLSKVKEHGFYTTEKTTP